MYRSSSAQYGLWQLHGFNARKNNEHSAATTQSWYSTKLSSLSSQGMDSNTSLRVKCSIHIPITRVNESNSNLLTLKLLKMRTYLTNDKFLKFDQIPVAWLQCYSQT